MTDTTSPAPYRAGADFVEEVAQHIPHLWVSVEPHGINVQPHPSATLAEQFEAMMALAERLGVKVVPSGIATAKDGHRFYSNDVTSSYHGVSVRGFQHVRVDELVAL